MESSVGESDLGEQVSSPILSLSFFFSHFIETDSNGQLTQQET